MIIRHDMSGRVCAIVVEHHSFIFSCKLTRQQQTNKQSESLLLLFSNEGLLALLVKQKILR